MNRRSKTSRTRAIALATLTAVGLAGWGAQATEPKTLTAAIGEYRPFTGAALAAGGMASAIVRDALADQGFTLEIVWAPWNRAARMVEFGQADISFPYVATPARKDVFAFSDSLFAPRRFLFRATSDAPNPDSFSALTGATICSPLGYSTPPALAPHADRFVLETPPAMQDCFRLLGQGGVDYVIANEVEGGVEAMATLVTPGRVEPVTLDLGRGENRVVVGRNHPERDEIIAAFNAGLAAMKTDGRFDALVEAHIGALRRFMGIGPISGSAEAADLPVQ